ncbi:MAG: PBECR2 nuclease fold domain-containing protein [Bacillota bacterium]|nr:PBECR2 nuclease fold domain-containing protein [Bacillota bacterium]
MSEIRNLGKINTKILEKEFGKIQTDEIIVTNERIDHIKERHPEDYNLFEKYGKESVSSLDLIIKDVKNKSTVFMIKKLPETNLNVVVRVVFETDNSKWKNSVMTFYRIRERNLKKLIEKNGVLYKKE